MVQEKGVSRHREIVGEDGRDLEALELEHESPEHDIGYGGAAGSQQKYGAHAEVEMAQNKGVSRQSEVFEEGEWYERTRCLFGESWWLDMGPFWSTQ